jgi:acetylornithine deacetylase/succinyl-diaminopimelate desuccinylase-like protein/WD40 repeat protein
MSLNSPLSRAGGSNKASSHAQANNSGAAATSSILEATQTLLTRNNEVVLSICVAPASLTLYCGVDSGEVYVWDLAYFTEKTTLRGHERAVLALTLHDDLLFSVGAGGQLVVWNVVTSRMLLCVVGHSGSIFCMTVCAGAGCLVLGGQDTAVKAISLAHIAALAAAHPGGKVQFLELNAVERHDHAGYVFALAHTDELLFSGSGDGSIRVWRLRIAPLGAVQLECLRTLRSHTGAVMTLAVDNESLYSGGQDAVITAWDLETFYVTHECRGHTSDVLTLAVSDEYLFSGSSDGELRAWRRGTMRAAPCHEQLHAPILAVCVANGSVIAGVGFVESPSAMHAGHHERARLFGEHDVVPATTTMTTSAAAAAAVAATTTTAAAAASISRNTSLTLIPNVRMWALRHGMHSDGEATSRRLRSDSVPDVSSLLSQGKSVPDVASALSNSNRVKSGDAGQAVPVLTASAETALLTLLKQFCAIRTVSGVAQYGNECWVGARFCRSVLESFGFDARLIEGAKGKNPLIFARTPNEDPSRPTVMFYGHYDVVGVDDASSWLHDPFTVMGLNGFLYGRGTSDNKGPVLAFAFAVRDLLLRGELSVNVVFVIEGEEENKSAGILDAIRAHRKAWFPKVDLLLLSNNYWLDESRPCLTYGMRGLIVFRITVRGPSKAVHSGMDGGLVSEPLAELAALLASLHDAATGRVAVEHFYDGVAPLTETERHMYDDINFDASAYARDIGAPGLAPHARHCTPTELLMKRWREPSISIHGVESTAASSTISTHGTATFSVRFVPMQEAQDLIAHVKAHVEQTFAKRSSANEFELEVLRRGDWWLGDPLSAPYVAAAKAIESVWGQRPAMTREGGSIPPVSAMARVLNCEVLVLPLGQSSDAAHLANERIRWSNLIKGKQVFEQTLIQLGKFER